MLGPILFLCCFLAFLTLAGVILVGLRRGRPGRNVTGGNESSARRVTELNPPPAGRAPGTMESAPVDNPLDYREDGSIQPGDPAWAFMEQVMNGGSGIARQNDDGTWTTEVISKDGEERS